MDKRLKLLRALFARDDGRTVDAILRILAGEDTSIAALETIPEANRRLVFGYLKLVRDDRDGTTAAQRFLEDPAAGGIQ
jgi:hypothetical protein